MPDVMTSVPIDPHIEAALKSIARKYRLPLGPLSQDFVAAQVRSVAKKLGYKVRIKQQK